MYKAITTIFILSTALFSCNDDEVLPQASCIEGEVVGKIRTAGGGVAVSLSEPMPGSVTWKEYENVVELLNVPIEYTFEGTPVYFKAREAKEGERGPISSDGDESIQVVLYGTEISNIGCPGN